MKKQILGLFLVSTILLVSCNKDDDDPMDPNNELKSTLTLNLDNLMASSDDEQYEGWIIVNGAPVSTGTFTVNANGELSKSSFEVTKTDLETATDFVLSIEPKPDNDPSPSAIKILGGTFSGSSADVSAAHGAALGNDFSMISGKYILATPTTTTTDDDLSGLWFLDPTGASPVSSLELPSLPSGWKYEGWSVIDGMPITSGTFSSLTGADDSAPFSGMDTDGPPFPGEDYIKNAPSGLSFPTDLSGGTIVISIEPSPDNSPDPFVFKPLVGGVPSSAQPMTLYDMMSNVSSFPAGSVSR